MEKKFIGTIITNTRYLGVGKPILDILLLIILSPLLIILIFIISVILLVMNKGSVFFSQSRPGKNGVLFSLWKFRTFKELKDSAGNLLPDEAQVGGFRSFLRRSSLDELPQVWNILNGEMSWIGPRPLLPEYLSLYTPEQNKRHLLKPGITGWAQVNGRNALTWESKFLFDLEYVRKVSLFFDLKILFLTLWHIIYPKGINQEGKIGAERWKGNAL